MASSASCCDSRCHSPSTGYFNTRVYLGEPFHGAADGGAVTGHHGPINQGLSKLGHAGNLFLLVRASFVLQVYGEGWEDKQTWSTQPQR